MGDGISLFNHARVFCFSAFLCLLLLMSACFTTTPNRKAEAPSFESRLEAALDCAGENRPEIAAFLEEYGDPEKEKAAAFLVANMPVVDLCTLSCRHLRDNLDLAFKAREELPWGRTPSFNLFLHYVLPHRVTQEAFHPWRAFFYESLKPALGDIDLMSDAAMAVNRWCDARTRFLQTEFRDQSAIDTLRSGSGRCEELMCITICALRAMGLPARPCSTPWWVVNDNNHAWVEVWADGAWHYLGGCESTDALNSTWFRGSAKRAGMVVSSMYGNPQGFETGEEVSGVYGKSAVINSTEVYAATCRLDITVKATDGAPAADCPVTVSVFNFGGLRPLTSATTDEGGKASIVVGMGDYFVAAGEGENRDHSVAHTEPGGQKVIALQLEKDKAPVQGFWLRYPTSAEADRMAATRPHSVSTVPVKIKPDLLEAPELDLYTQEKDRNLESVIAGLSEPDGFREILKDAGANWPSLGEALKVAPAGLHEDLHAFLKQTSHLDRLEMNTNVILDHVIHAAAARPEGLEEDIYRDYLLNARVYLEHLDAYRQRLAEDFADCKEKPPADTARNLAEKIASKIKSYEGERLAPFMNPLQVWRSGRARADEAAILAVGVLRSLGIPARKVAHRPEAAFYDQGVWTAFDPMDPKSMEEKAAQEEGEGSAEKKTDAKIRLNLMREGKPDPDFEGFAVATFRSGGWIPLRNLETEKEGDDIICTVPPGTYLVTAGARNANGDPWVQTAVATPGSGETKEVAFNIDLPADAGVFKFPVVRELESYTDTPLTKEPGAKGLNEQIKEDALLLVFYRSDHEPSTRTLALVAEAMDPLAAVGVKGFAIHLPLGREGLFDAGINNSPLIDVPGDFAFGEAFGLPLSEDGAEFTALPSVLLLNKGGKPLLWVEGYDLKIGDLLRQAARMVK
ncbi:MAG: transglutaminase-like domain-containing protein [Planctomycetes bacterium]|nr:transglutaminase-like domain-containing protein [Planctomycetota bacterium]